jgi:uncharacterized protein involved in response to NO
MNKPQIFDYPLFALGFRAFFALAGLSALALIAVWRSIFAGTVNADSYFPAVYWHAHEMLLGYTVAVMAGFLLTAVKNWTGKQTLQGDKLAGLCLLWIYGRVLPFYADSFPPLIIALVDVSFLPILAYCLAKPIIETGKFRNLIFPALLLVMATGNLLIHLQLLHVTQHSAQQGLTLVTAMIVMMILVIAGRVFPFFTERGLSNVLILPNPVVDAVALASAAIVFALQLLQVSGTALLIVALIAVFANLLRIANWFDRRIVYIPLLWVLYTGYAWLIAGFLLTALTAYGWVSASLSLHAFTIGGIGVLTLGMMARVSLGHTGRALRVSNAIALAFTLLNIAVLFRVVMPMALPTWYSYFIYISTACWLAAFSLFVFIYMPILTSARMDGKEG